MPLPAVGEFVDYRMSEDDVAPWEAEWGDSPRPGSTFNLPEVGDVLPALVLAVHEVDVNLRVFLDGRFDFWAKERAEGTEPGTWAFRTEG